MKIDAITDKTPLLEIEAPNNPEHNPSTEEKTEGLALRILSSINSTVAKIGDFLWKVVTFPYTIITAIRNKIFREEKNASSLVPLVQEPIGLKNPSNNCWANAVLQCIFNSSTICKILENPHTRDSVPSVLSSLYNAYFSRNNSSPDKCNSQMLREWLSDHGTFHRDFRVQEDAHEALIKVLGSLELEYQLNVHINGDPSNEEERIFTMLPLTLDTSEKNFHTLIDKFFNEMDVDNGRVIHRQFEKSPQELFVFATRFVNEGTATIKRTDALNIPLHYHLAAAHEEATYALTSCIIHQGNTANSGHYIALIKKSNDWYKCSDLSVEKLENQQELEQLLSAGYIFHFTKSLSIENS